MGDWIYVNQKGAVEFFGVELLGINVENGRKLLFSLIFIVVLFLLSAALRWLSRRVVLRGRRNVRVEFWTNQAIRLATTVLLLVGIASIWFDDPNRLATFLGLMSAGVAFALQKVITALAGYFVILRGKTFNVGDRIRMGGVRGDVIDLGFIQTTIMEMGEPPSVQSDEPAMWVRARQYTGRVVTVTNDKIFGEPVYNYTREFPYIWEEMRVPITYTADRPRAERILLEVAQRHTVPIQELGEEAVHEMERRYAMKRDEFGPRVYYRLTSNWLELTVRFITREHGIRDIKDAMSRDIIAALDTAGIGIASTTFEVVGLPPLRVERVPPNGHK